MIASGMTGSAGEVGYQYRLHHRRCVCNMGEEHARLSAKSKGTLKHLESLTCYDELCNWEPMNFLMSQKGESMGTTR